MKKKIWLFITSCLFLIVLTCVFSLNASAVVGHHCSGGFDPVIDIKANRLSITGCRNCKKSFVSGMPYIEPGISEGQDYFNGQYTIKINDVYSCNLLLTGCKERVISLYEGCDGTKYPMSTTKPTAPGTYKIYITTLNYYNYYLQTGSRSFKTTNCSGREIITQTLTVGVKYYIHDINYYTDNEYLCVGCTACGEIDTASLNISDGFRVGHIEKEDISIVFDEWSSLSSEDVIILYEGRNQTSYSLSTQMPTAAGDYTASVTLKSKWNGDEAAIKNCRSKTIAFTIDEDYHKWEYKSDGDSITANCRFCNANAKVSLDSSNLYESARNYDTDNIGQKLFNEENWSTYPNIAKYSIIYDGKEIFDNTDDNSSTNISTTKLYSSTVAPEGSGNYFAYLAILKNQNIVSSDNIIVKTDGVPFYIAGYSFKRCKVVEYGNNEKALLQKPKYENGKYYVGTLDDLLWCVYNQTTDMNIVLTNDIVVNPITVTEDGNISTGALTIYKWPGFGTQNARFGGTIDGQGHTIYGLYFPESRTNDWVSGFICWGKNVQIKNLNIENSYIKGNSAAGVFCGELQINDSKDACIVNCKSIDNLVIAGSEAGGFIGWLGGVRSTAANSYFKIESCVNDSFVNGSYSGGIVGKTCPSDDFICNGIINKCYNYGKITGTEFAAGIIGYITIWHHLGFTVTNCLNDGYIKANDYVSGIIAYLYTNGSGGALVKGCINVSNNINTGELSFTCKNISDIIARTGGNDYCQTGLLTLKDNYYSQSKNAYPVGLTNAPAAKKLTNTQITEGKICELTGHVPNDHYSDIVIAGCTTKGTKNLRCATCNAILETVTTNPHGHSYGADGRCTYCQARKTLTGSTFSDNSWIAVVIIVVALIGAGAVIVVKKKKSVK